MESYKWLTLHLLSHAVTYCEHLVELSILFPNLPDLWTVAFANRHVLGCTMGWRCGGPGEVERGVVVLSKCV